ncbi:hypothetical protein HYT84_00850 [Candidatus Micrarchaeota archaeon]|nr:hypothetical protein [Candidatus Micrarchaeota archaeon]
MGIKKKLNKNASKGQAAMEYLMTYGWAILVIVIVIAALLFLNPFKAPETCLFQQPGFTCSEIKPLVFVDPDSGNTVKVKFTMINKNPNGVFVHKIYCSTAPVGDLKFEGLDGPSSAGSTSGDDVGAGASRDFEVPCYNTQGSPLTLAANSEIKGTVAVWFNYNNDPNYKTSDIKRFTTATLVSTVLQG